MMMALSILRYSGPVAFLLFLSINTIVGSRQINRGRAVSQIDRWTIALSVVFAYIVEGFVANDKVAHLLSLNLLWILATLVLVQAPWYYRTGAALATCGFEVALTILECDTTTTKDRFVFASRIIRDISLFALAFFPLFPWSGDVQATDLETQPLLPKTTGTEPEQEGQDSDYDQFIKKRQKERLESSDNWWEYIKAYKIFLPLIIPRKNVKLQLCLLATLLSMLVQRVLALLVPRQLGIIVNSLSKDHRQFPLKEILIWMLLYYLESSAGIPLILQFVERPFQIFSHRKITLAAFNHVMSLSADFHNDSDSAELIQAVRQGYAVGNFLEMLATQILPEIIDLVVGCIYFYHLFGIYVCYIVLLAASAYICLSVNSANWIREPRRESNRLNRQEQSILHQAIHGWQTTYFFNNFTWEADRVREAVVAAQKASWQEFWRSTVGRTLRYLVIDLAFFGVNAIAVYKIVRDEIPIGSFVVLSNYWWTLTGPIMSLTSYYQHLQETLIDAERLLILLQTKPTVVDKENANNLKVTDGKVSFDKVNFSYDPRKSVITDVSFETKPGQTIALVGETGGGKSTIFKLLWRCYDVTQGSISIDDQDIRDIRLHSLRDTLGIVEQSPCVFNVSIAENLRYAKLDATMPEIEAACKAAAIHEKILTFPDGYNSVVGQRGVKLSGGELQRIAIARVLLKNPKIVLLDEATSAVDTDTEFVIQAALKALSKNRTTFVIAHRLSTVVAADLVLVVQEGRIIERGTHKELLRVEGGKYKGLWAKQVMATAEGIVGADEGLVKRVKGVVESELLDGDASSQGR